MTKSDVDIGGFGSFTDFDHRSFGLIGRVGMKNLTKTGAPQADLATESSFTAACGNFVTSRHQSENAIDAAIVSRSTAGGKNLRRRRLSSALFKIGSAINVDLLLNDRVSIGVCYLARDDAAAHECEINVFNVFIFTDEE